MRRLTQGATAIALVVGSLAFAPSATPAGAVTNSFADEVGDVDAPVEDITSVDVTLDGSTVSFAITTATPLPPISDPSWDARNFNEGRIVGVNIDNASYGGIALGGPDGVIAWGQGGDEISLDCDGETFSIVGNVTTMSAPAACFRNPGLIEAQAYLTRGPFQQDYSPAWADFTGFGRFAPTDQPPFAATLKASLPGGYYALGADGGVFSFGDAPFYGSTGSLTLNKPVVAMAAQPGGGGYRFVATDGGIFAYGNAGFFGSMGGKPLNKPIVGMATTADGGGYWLVASDGGIFAFGNAGFFGSTGSMKLNKPIVGMTPAPDGNGYWMVASDGGIFSFGSANFHGSAGSINLNSPIIGMAPTPDGGGYLLAAEDGGIFTYGNAAFAGSGVGLLNEDDFTNTFVDIAASGSGYYLVDNEGAIYNFGPALDYSDLVHHEIPLNQDLVGMAVRR